MQTLSYVGSKEKAEQELKWNSIFELLFSVNILQSVNFIRFKLKYNIIVIMYYFESCTNHGCEYNSLLKVIFLLIVLDN